MKNSIVTLSICLLYLQTYAQPIYENFPSSGTIEITLHPGASVNLGTNQLVSFGVPFPRSTVNAITDIIVTDRQGNELASDIKELTRWHSLSDDPNVNGVRSALLYINMIFTDLNPTTIQVVYGQNRTLELGDQGIVKNHWVVVKDPNDEYIDDTNNANYVELKEPPVYATLPTEWMSACVIRNKFIPTSQATSDYQWYDEAMVNFGKTAINDVNATVLDEHKVNILEPSPWLFDRGGCLWNAYMKTGDLKWLKAAHKASQFYAHHLNDEGWFDLKGRDDLKYSFSGSMLIGLMLTGDKTLTTKILNVAKLAERKDFFLKDGYSFWTERHFTYWLLGPLSAFEATGEEKYKILTNERATHAFFRAKNPINGYQPEGGLIHPMGPHEGANRPGDGEEDVKGYYQPIISPWLSALMADAFWRYYLHSEDEETLRFLIGLGENITTHCFYTVEDTHTNINGNIQTYYLWSGQTNERFRDNGIYWKPWDDNEHALDVMTLLARAQWAQKKLGLTDTPELTTRINDLLVTSKYSIEKWTRTFPEKPVYRLEPPRKYNWWFGTTSDLEWLMTNTPDATVLTIDEFQEETTEQFAIHPNPINNTLYINATEKINSDDTLQLNIYDLNGRKLSSHKMTTDRTKNSLTLDYLASGVYFLRIASKTSKETLKFIKK